MKKNLQNLNKSFWFVLLKYSKNDKESDEKK